MQQFDTITTVGELKEVISNYPDDHKLIVHDRHSSETVFLRERPRDFQFLDDLCPKEFHLQISTDLSRTFEMAWAVRDLLKGLPERALKYPDINDFRARITTTLEAIVKEFDKEDK